MSYEATEQELHELLSTVDATVRVRLGMDRATISGVVARLKRRNLVLYKPDPLDKRSRIIAYANSPFADL